MKYAIILPDGVADEPIELLGGKTPLGAATTPNMDWISTNGRQGIVVTVPKGLLPGSEVATLSLFGYDPNKCYTGRAPLEAAARQLTARADQLIFRCNFVTIVDGTMEDFTAGHISQQEADRLIADLNEHIADNSFRFHSGVSYRNLMVATLPIDFDAVCTPPHGIPGQPAVDHLPLGTGDKWIQRVMERARRFLKDHQVNTVRRDLGENPATDIWLWGQGKPRSLENFESRFGVRGAIIATVDLIRGIALSAGLDVLDTPGATGLLDTNYEGKGAAAVEALDNYDLVIVHVEAPDESGHLGDAYEKVKAIEQVDELVIGPILDRLQTFDFWKILVAPDHPTPVEKKIHTSTPLPFCLAGTSVQSVMQKPFTEDLADHSDLHIDPGHELMEYFLRPQTNRTTLSSG